MDIRVTLADSGSLKPIPDVLNLEFGKQTTDHMFRMEYCRDQGWQDARMTPYEALSLDPSALVLHYNQQIFEGLKAFRQSNGSVSLFSPDQLAKRFCRSATRMAMPVLDDEMFLESIRQLVAVEDRWVPSDPSTSLYIRPTMIATEPGLGVRASNTYLYYVIVCPVAAYYKEGAKPTRIAVEESGVRAAPGVAVAEILFSPPLSHYRLPRGSYLPCRILRSGYPVGCILGPASSQPEPPPRQLSQRPRNLRFRQNRGCLR